VHSEGSLDAEGEAVFVKILQKVAAFCGVTLVTYCVMDSHFHLLIKVPPRAARERVTDKELMRRFRVLYGSYVFVEAQAQWVAKLLKRKKSFKRVLNDALRESLQPKTSTPELLAPRPMGLAPGVDPRRLSDLADDLEAEAFLAAESKRS